MKIVFILPFQNDGLEPLGILSLAGMLKKVGHEVHAILPSKREISHNLQTLKPDILAYSVVSGWHQHYIILNQWIKKNFAPSALSVFGGPHPTYFPAYIYEDGVDAICRGEGEYAFVEFVTKLEKQEDYFTSKNWWVKHNGLVYKNTFRPEIQDMDTLPFQDRSLLEPYTSYFNRSLRAFSMSRGCPFNCSYCFNHAYRDIYRKSGLKTSLRCRSVDNVIAEIKQVSEKYSIQSIAFFDDVFNTSVDWLDEFSDKYKYQVGLPFECNLRVEQITARVVSTLKRAGCAIIAVGIEVADEEMRAAILRRRYTTDELIRACAIIKENGILLKTYNIFGIPPGKLNSDIDTLKLNGQLRVDIPTASIYQPYPGTDLGEKAQFDGYWDGNLDQIRLGFYKTSILKLRDKTKIELLQKYFFIFVKFPILMPLLKPVLSVTNFALFRYPIFWLHQTFTEIAIFLSKKILGTDTIRRNALSWLASRKYFGER